MATEYWRGDEAVVTTQVEATYGAFAIGSAADQVYCSGISILHGGRVDAAPPALGLGTILNKQKNARWADVRVDLIPWIYGLFDWLLIDIMREDALPSATDYTDIFTIDPVGTHIDGSTGCTIVLGTGASASDFANWNTYNGATSNGAAGMMIEPSGWGDASNNVPMAIKAVNASQIDIAAPYSTTGATAGVMGALKVAETDTAAVTLKIGQGIRVLSADNYRSRSFEVDSQTATVPYAAASGQVLNTLPFTVTGNGYATLGPGNYIGQNYSTDAAATRYSGTINEDTDIEKPPFAGNSNMTYCVINGANHFAGENLTSVGFTLNQNATPPPDIGGRETRPIIRPGTFDVTGASLAYTDDPGTLTAALQTLEAAQGAAGEAPVDIKLSNGTQFVWLRLPRCVFQLGERPVTSGFVTGSVAIEAMAQGQDIGPFIFQSFAS